ncbi:hypothetical protein HYW73_02110 [Candidatus Nomurabacteria bacterium]|nr:hypothetical protein [Candidatus Nomurabacteria bacterium]
MCVSDESGEKTCIIKSELDTLLSNASTTPSPEEPPLLDQATPEDGQGGEGGGNSEPATEPVAEPAPEPSP